MRTLRLILLCILIVEIRFAGSYWHSFVKSKATAQFILKSDNLIDGIRRSDFPILQTEVYPGKPLIFLDSAASSQKPIHVINAMSEYYKTTHANVHRGAYSIANTATELFENARIKVQQFTNAKFKEEIIFTRGATEAINLVALSFGSSLSRGDEIILSVMEHHSNLVPWQLLASRTGVVLKFAQLNDAMALDLDHLKSLVTSKTKLIAIASVSNVLGVVNPIREIVQIAKTVGAKVLVDACQAAPHLPIDVQAIPVDFLVASSHKMCGPTGIGFLYGRLELLEKMPPIFGGGEMIEQVNLYSSTYAPCPAKFEAGTPAIAEAVGLSAAIDYLNEIGMKTIRQHEKELTTLLYAGLQTIPGLQIYGPDPLDARYERSGLASFNVNDIHPGDLAVFLDQEGVAVRTGHHCAQPLHKTLGIPGSMRASLYFYNNRKDIDDFLSILDSTIRTLRRFN